jgi:hypothetical protein
MDPRAAEGFMALASARDRAEVRQALLDHPFVLRKAGQEFARELIARIARAGGPDTQHIPGFEQRLHFLEQCHDIGVEAALDEVPSSSG